MLPLLRYILHPLILRFCAFCPAHSDATPRVCGYETFTPKRGGSVLFWARTAVGDYTTCRKRIDVSAIY